MDVGHMSDLKYPILEVKEYNGSKNCPHVWYFWKDLSFLAHLLCLTKVLGNKSEALHLSFVELFRFLHNFQNSLRYVQFNSASYLDNFLSLHFNIIYLLKHAVIGDIISGVAMLGPLNIIMMFYHQFGIHKLTFSIPIALISS